MDKIKVQFLSVLFALVTGKRLRLAGDGASARLVLALKLLASFNTPNTNQRFSDATYSLPPSRLIGLVNTTIREIINHFFSHFIKRGSKYFLLIRFRSTNGSIKTIHKGIVISSLLLEAYLKYINNVLSLKSNYYHSEPSAS